MGVPMVACTELPGEIAERGRHRDLFASSPKVGIMIGGGRVLPRGSPGRRLLSVRSRKSKRPENGAGSSRRSVAMSRPGRGACVMDDAPPLHRRFSSAFV